MRRVQIWVNYFVVMQWEGKKDSATKAQRPEGAQRKKGKGLGTHAALQLICFTSFIQKPSSFLSSLLISASSGLGVFVAECLAKAHSFATCALLFDSQPYL
jgi:hypothetical protein